jgi:hypothetical protein
MCSVYNGTGPSSNIESKGSLKFEKNVREPEPKGSNFGTGEAVGGGSTNSWEALGKALEEKKEKWGAPNFTC